MTDLSTIDPSDLLTAFINNYNKEQEENENVRVELSNSKLELNVLTDENKQLKQQIAQQDKDLTIASQGIADAEKLATISAAQKTELVRVREQLTTMQQELTALNSQRNLKDQVIRVKAKSEEKSKTITRLTGELSTAQHKLNQANADKEACKKVVEMQRVALDNNKAQGLYHNGDHHLVIWPQSATMQRPDGSEFNGTNLLYLHQSGRGGFITFDPQSDKSALASSPKGGLKPSKETIDFAHNWLYKVNQMQQGEIKDDDRVAINYNG